MIFNKEYHICSEISENIDIRQVLQLNIQDTTRGLCNYLLADDCLNENDLRNLANMICNDLNIICCRVSLTSLPVILWNRRARAYGIYNPKMCLFTSPKIRIARRDWKAKGSPVLSNTHLVGSLLHEILHHIDYEMLLLGWNVHDKGFFRRFDDLQKSLGIQKLIRHSKT